MRYLLLFLLFPVVAFAQQVDPRLAPSMVQALQAEINLRDAVLHAMQEDQAKKEADLTEWFKGWFGDDNKH
jgi:hypothetical protein